MNRRLATQLGLQRAFLLHLAHPLIAAATADHSIFAGCPHEGWGRLQRTVERMAALWAGTPDQTRHAAASINAIHDRVDGCLQAPVGVFPAGTPYSATDPDLLLWVQATLLDSLLRSYQLFVGPLSTTEQDRYCADAAPIAAMLRIPEGRFPTTAAALDEYLAVTIASGVIEVGDTARQLARNLLFPPMPRLGHPFARMVRLTSTGLLPPAIRRGYGLSWTRRDRMALTTSAALIRIGQPLTPSISVVFAGFHAFQRIYRGNDRLAPTA